MNNEYIQLVIDGNLKKFYKCKAWLRLRPIALARDNNECQRCKGLGAYSKAECVHHVVEVKVNPMRALDIDNLMCLCNECHNIVHGKHKNLKRFKKKERFSNVERW